jgi:S-adenosylmethionine/arginine decarboxylase-like enzyme
MHIVENAGMKVLHASVTPFPDGTVNGHLDLSESHFSFGTYRKGRGFSGELNICNENEENLSKGRRAVKSFRRFLKPKTADIKEDPWSL